MDFEVSSDQLNADLSDHNIFSSPVLVSRSENDVLLPGYKEELTTKRAVELLIAGTLKTKVCRYCLNIVSSLSELDQILQIAGTGVLHKVTIRAMVASFYPFKVESDPNFPNKICNKCLNRTISAYLFTQQCEQSERALRNCFDDMYDKLEKLDPLERPKKRGRQKRNPNYNTIYANHDQVIDYAEPIMNIVNTKSVSLSKEPAMSDLECPKCWQLFTKVEDLMLHEKTHLSSMWFNCRLCGKSFVKRLQLKRHLKQTHIKSETVVTESHDNKFECKTCDLRSDDYSTHLQHMEKHKFQTVLEHLVEKDMDKLCAVCLDKAPKLVDLDKMVRLHGGYPGVTGDKTLYSILGSTLPDHKSYKYQELHVAHPAKIMKLSKLTKDKESKKVIQDRKEVTEGNVNQIIISNPLIISNDKIDVEEMYMFFFSDASFYKEPEENKPALASLEYKGEELNKLDTEKKTHMNEEFEKSHENINANDSLFNTAQETNKIEHCINDADAFISIEAKADKEKEIVLSKADYKVTENEKTITAKNNELCKTCWIFSKPTCNKCINKLEVTDINEIINNTENQKQKENCTEINSNITEDDCKYCWLFKSCPKCDYCKKINENQTVTIFTKTENDGNETYNIKETVISNTEAQRKTKLKEFETNPELKKWDCHVCLITNTMDRQTCVCCESNKYNQNETVKVNWDFKNPFNVTPDNDVQYQIDPCEEMDVETIEEINLQHEESLKSPNEIYNLHGNFVKEPENLVSTENTNEEAEEMDVTDAEHFENTCVDPNLHFLNAVPNNVGIPSYSLQFNLGIGSPEKKNNRRIVKPIRRMAYHK